MKAILSPEIATRDEFAALLNRRGYWGVAVEVGTHKAGFAAPFMDVWNGRELWCVDPYAAYPGLLTRDWDQFAAWSRMAKHAHRVVFARQPDSEELASGIVNSQGRPVFVYIDGDHSYAGVRRDIEIWWDRISPVGILAGHDFTPELPGVMRAVDEFRTARGLTLYVTHDRAYKSWYVYRNQTVPPLDNYVSLEIDVPFIPDEARENAANSPSFGERT